jgi:TolB-like protein
MFKAINIVPLSLAVFAVLLSGCANTQISPRSVVDYNYIGADAIAAEIRGNPMSAGPVLIASLANIDKLESSSTFGRISADEIGSRLSQHGFLVVEPRMRTTFVVRQGGEFMLSDEVKLLAKEQKAASVLVGTYADSGTEVLVSLRLIRVADSFIIASSDYSVPMQNQMHEALIGE